MPKRKTKGTQKTTARNRRPVGKPKGKAQGVKPKPNKDQPMEFRLKIKPKVEVFWSFMAKAWVVWVEAETGKKMAKPTSGLLAAAKLVTQVQEVGSVNPNHWQTDIRKHPQDVISNDYIRDAILEAPGLTYGRENREEEAVWSVYMKGGMNGYKDEEPVVMWSCPAKAFTRTVLVDLQRLVDAYKAGYECAMTTMGAKPGRKK